MYDKYLTVKKCKVGEGVFTSVRIPANSMIMEMVGSVIVDRDVPPTSDWNMYLQVGPNTYIGPSGGTDDYINHNCDPNCRMHIVGNRAFLYSLYVIPVGAELTFDYSTTSTDSLDSWKMDCTCNSNKCRKIISGYQYLDTPLFNNYKDRNMFPLYITEPGILQKK